MNRVVRPAIISRHVPSDQSFKTFFVNKSRMSHHNMTFGVWETFAGGLYVGCIVYYAWKVGLASPYVRCNK